MFTKMRFITGQSFPRKFDVNRYIKNRNIFLTEHIQYFLFFNVGVFSVTTNHNRPYKARVIIVGSLKEFI